MQAYMGWEQYTAHLMVKTIYFGPPQVVSHATAQEITRHDI